MSLEVKKLMQISAIILVIICLNSRGLKLTFNNILEPLYKTIPVALSEARTIIAFPLATQTGIPPPSALIVRGNRGTT